MKNLKYILLLLVFAGCASGPTTDVCTLEKHDDDNLFQVCINDIPINKFWYLKEDGLDIWRQLAADNKCMPMK